MFFTRLIRCVFFVRDRIFTCRYLSGVLPSHPRVVRYKKYSCQRCNSTKVKYVHCPGITVLNFLHENHPVIYYKTVEIN